MILVHYDSTNCTIYWLITWHMLLYISNYVVRITTMCCTLRRVWNSSFHGIVEYINILSIRESTTRTMILYQLCNLWVPWCLCLLYWTLDTYESKHAQTSHPHVQLKIFNTVMLNVHRLFILICIYIFRDGFLSLLVPWNCLFFAVTVLYILFIPYCVY